MIYYIDLQYNICTQHYSTIQLCGNPWFWGRIQCLFSDVSGRHSEWNHELDWNIHRFLGSMVSAGTNLMVIHLSWYFWCHTADQNKKMTRLGPYGPMSEDGVPLVLKVYHRFPIHMVIWGLNYIVRHTQIWSVASIGSALSLMLK